MKLIDVTNTKTYLLFEEAPNIPKGTIIKKGNKRYKWQGNSWREVNRRGQMKGPVLKTDGLGGELTSQWKKANPVQGSKAVSGFKLLPGVAQTATGGVVVLPDGKTVITTNTFDEAKSIQDKVEKLSKQNNAKKVTSLIIEDPKIKGSNSVKIRSNPINRTVTALNIQDFDAKMKARKNTAVGRWLTGRGMTTIRKFVAFMPVNTFAMFFGVMAAVADVEVEIQEAAGDPQRQTELEEIKSILQGQAFTYLMLPLAQMLAKTKLVKKMLSPIKWSVRAAQGAAAATGVGAAISIPSLLLSEAAWFLIPMIIAMPVVQRSIAEFLAGSFLGDVFEGVGETGMAALGVADRALDGKFGTGWFRDKMEGDLTPRNLDGSGSDVGTGRGGFEEKIKKGRKGTYYGNSQWAKLVFGSILFPPDQKSRLVPYIAPSRREQLLNSLMELNPIDAQPQPQPAPGANPNTSSQPGLPTNPDALPGPQ
tara:strand:- start:1968 stop:3401 length:1434 start_codon:yes stop_codon:yes gene_type:complete